MRRQDQEALDQAAGDHGDHHERDGGDYFADDAGDNQERGEGGYGRQRRTDHRGRHAPGAAFRRRQGLQAGAPARLGVFADDDGLVHHHADGHDEAEQADHIDRLAADEHDRHGGEEGNRNPRGDPERHPGAQENEQNQDDEDKAAETVAQQQVDTALDQVRGGQILLDLQVRRQGGPEFPEIGIDDRRLFERVGAERPADVELDRRLAKAFRGLAVLVETFIDSRDVAQINLLTALERLDLDMAEALGFLYQPETADLPLGGAPRGARGQVLGGLADALGDVGKLEVETQKRLGPDLDPDLLVAGAEHVHLLDAAIEKRVANTLGERLQRGLGIGAGNDEAADRVVTHRAADFGTFAVLGQGGHLTDRRLDVGQRRLHVGAGLELDGDRGAALDGGGADPLDAVDETDLGLDRLDDVGVDVLGAGAGPLDIDGDQVDTEIGEELYVQPRQRKDARQDHERHQEVRRRRMAREYAYQPATGLHHRISTLRPGPISGNRVVTTRSPGSKGPRTSTSLPTRSTSSIRRATRRPSSAT